MSTITQLLCNKFGGIRERNAYFSSDIITAEDMQNVELFYTGTDNGIGIRTVKGNISINNTLENEAKIIKLFESTQKQEKIFFVYAETDIKGTLYQLDFETDTLTVIKDNLSPTGNANGFDVVQGYSDLFFFTNGIDMFTIEITATVNVVDMNLTDRDGNSVIGLCSAIFDNRLWIASDNKIWYSVQANIYDFSTSDAEITTSAGYIELLKNITAIHEYLGTLAVFFADSSIQIRVNDGIFSCGDESPAGCAGYNSLVFHDTNLYFYDDTKKSVYSFQQVITGEKTLGENIAVEIQSILLSLDNNDLNKIQAYSVFMEGRNEIWWIIPTNNDNYSTILIFDYLKGEWIKRKSQKINSVSILNNTLYSAGNDGNILEEYNSDTFNGEYIQHYYNCSPCNLGADNTLKVFVFPPRVSFILPSSNFYVKYIKNFNLVKKPKTKLIKSKLKNFMKWGEGYWGVNYWTSRNVNIIGKFPNATFKILEIQIYTTETLQSFQ